MTGLVSIGTLCSCCGKPIIQLEKSEWVLNKMGHFVLFPPSKINTHTLQQHSAGILLRLCVSSLQTDVYILKTKWPKAIVSFLLLYAKGMYATACWHFEGICQAFLMTCVISFCLRWRRRGKNVSLRSLSLDQSFLAEMLASVGILWANQILPFSLFIMALITLSSINMVAGSTGGHVIGS